MSIFQNEPQATKVTFSKATFSVHLVDGRVLEVPLAYFPRLLHAKPNQRKTYELSGDGTGIHWDHLDEDISVEGLLLGVGDRTRRSAEPAQRRKTA